MHLQTGVLTAFLNTFQQNIFYVIFALLAAPSLLISMESVKNYILSEFLTVDFLKIFLSVVPDFGQYM
jgi:hypothetical protein